MTLSALMRRGSLTSLATATPATIATATTHKEDSGLSATMTVATPATEDRGSRKPVARVADVMDSPDHDNNEALFHFLQSNIQTGGTYFRCWHQVRRYLQENLPLNLFVELDRLVKEAEGRIPTEQPVDVVVPETGDKQAPKRTKCKDCVLQSRSCPHPRAQAEFGLLQLHLCRDFRAQEGAR